MRTPPPRAVAMVALALVATACTDGVAPEGGPGVHVAFSLLPVGAVSQSELGALGNAFARVDAYAVAVSDSASGADVLSTTVPVMTSGENAHVLDLTFPPAAAGQAVHVVVVGKQGAIELYRAEGYGRVEVTAAPHPLLLSLRYSGPGVRGIVRDASGAPLSAATVQLIQGQAVVGSTTTEVDGTYLFLPTSEGGPLATGAYQVSVVPPAQQFVCPGARLVTATAESAHVANFAVGASGCPIDLLVLSGGDVDDTQTVAAMFASSPNVIARTFFFVNRLPGVDYLSQFDVVLLFANGFFNESVMLGSELTAYVQAGGNLVISSFYWQNRSDANLGSPGWGTLEGIDPFSSSVGGETYQAGSLGTVTTGDALTSDALVAGLGTLTSTGFRGGAVAKTGTTVVARWGDGTPLIGYRIMPGGQRLVAVSLFPASGQSASGDVTALWTNAVQWTGEAGGPVGTLPQSAPVFDAMSTAPGDAQTSQLLASGGSIQMSDDFVLSAAASIEHVEWSGIYCVQTVGAPAPSPTATAFTVGFYPDLGNAPDLANPISVATYPMSRVAQTHVHTVPNGLCGTASPTAIPFYRYALTLNTPFAAAAGTRYWLSVRANTPNLSVYWGWLNGPTSNGRSIQRIQTGADVIFTTDRSFSLRTR